MKTTADFLDSLRAKLDLPSDGQLAERLGMHRQYMSKYRTLSHTFDDAMSLRVAEILEIDGSYVMACMHHQRAKAPEVKAAWKHTAEVLGGLAAMLAMVALLPFLELPANGLKSSFDNNAYYASQNIHYANIAICLIFFGVITLLVFYKGKPDDSKRD